MRFLILLLAVPFLYADAAPVDGGAYSVWRPDSWDAERTEYGHTFLDPASGDSLSVEHVRHGRDLGAVSEVRTSGMVAAAEEQFCTNRPGCGSYESGGAITAGPGTYYSVSSYSYGRTQATTYAMYVVSGHDVWRISAEDVAGSGGPENRDIVRRFFESFAAVPSGGAPEGPLPEMPDVPEISDLDAWYAYQLQPISEMIPDVPEISDLDAPTSWGHGGVPVGAFPRLDGFLYYVSDLADVGAGRGAIAAGITDWLDLNPGLSISETEDRHARPAVEFRIHTVAPADYWGLATNHGAGLYTVDLYLGSYDCKGRFVMFSDGELRNTASHEIGHVLGLDHTSVPGMLMYAPDGPPAFDPLGLAVPAASWHGYEGQAGLLESIGAMDSEMAAILSELEASSAEIEALEADYYSSLYPGPGTVDWLNSKIDAYNSRLAGYDSDVREYNALVERYNCYPGNN